MTTRACAPTYRARTVSDAGPKGICDQEGPNSFRLNYTAKRTDMSGTRKAEEGDEQVFGQAAAVLVSLPTFLATELDPVALPAFLRERLAFACPADAILLLPCRHSVIG